MLTEIVEGKLSAVIAETLDQDTLYNVLDFPNNGITNALMSLVLTDARVAAFFEVGDIFICTDGGEYLINHQYKFTGEAWEDITPKTFDLENLPEGQLTRVRFGQGKSKAISLEFSGKLLIVDSEGTITEADHGDYSKTASFLSGQTERIFGKFTRIYGKVTKIVAAAGAEIIDASECDTLKSIKSTSATSVVFPETLTAIEDCDLPNCTSVDFPKTLKQLTTSNFAVNRKANIQLPEDLDTITHSLVGYNSDSITVPANVTGVSIETFKDSKLKYITFECPAFSVYDSSKLFQNCKNLIAIFVPADHLADYKRNFSPFADKIYPINGAYGETITVATSAWTETEGVYTASVEAIGVTSNSNMCLVSWYTTDGTMKVDNIYAIECIAQGNKSLTFKADKLPTENIKVRVETTLTNY